MSLSSLLKKASSLLGLSSPESPTPPPLDGEIIYCKNNVCVHPPAALSSDDGGSGDHYPGYLNIRSQHDQVLGSTLILSWIPNSTLKKNPRSIENSPRVVKVSPRRSPRQEYSKPESQSVGSTPINTPIDCAHFSRSHHKPAYESYKSQASDSGISQDLSTHEVLIAKDLPSRVTQNDQGKAGNVILEVSPLSDDSAVNGDGEMSSESESPSTDAQLASLLKRNKLISPAVHITRGTDDTRRHSSNHSVTSIEMDGDNLVVVTEELEESPFVDDHPVKLLKTDRENGHVIRDLPSEKTNDIGKLKESLDLKLNMAHRPAKSLGDDAECISSASSSTSGPDSRPPSPITPPEYFTPTPSHSYTSQQSPVVSHNLSFPANSVIYHSSDKNQTQTSAKQQICGVFSVDLGQMRSVRVFYTDAGCSCGQLVIASRESQYKVLHFHHGGLDRLTDTLAQWKFLAQPKRDRFSLFPRPAEEETTRCLMFSVIRPHLSGEQCHPEEGAYEQVNEDTWKTHMNESGVIEDDYHLRRAIFFAGIEASLRHEMWPFLLHYYPYNSTHEEREQIRNDKYIIYQNIRRQREEMSEEEQERFFRAVQCIVEKDVVRTDRSHPYFRGEDNPNIETLKNILLNYAVAHPSYGYTQGMSDLLSPVLVEVQNEVDAYWCFLGLMQRTIFVSSPKDVDMDKQLMLLRELLRLLLPHFYEHLLRLQDGLELLFCHRWILLCFKREFSEQDALCLWEACWSHYQTDYFHLFLCVAIMALYGQDVVDQDLSSDDMLLHFSCLSMHMSGPVVLRKGRGLLHEFRSRSTIPCSLQSICTLCSPGMWDSGHVPAVECPPEHPPDSPCPHQP